jgi:PAS domain-containing protein
MPPTVSNVVYITSEHPLSVVRRMVMEQAGYRVELADSVEAVQLALQTIKPFLVVIGALTERKIAADAIAAVRRKAPGTLVLSLNQAAKFDADYTLPMTSGPEELLAMIGEALIRHHGHPGLEAGCYMYVNSDRRYIHVSDAAADMLGYERRELIGRTIDEISPPEMQVPERFQEYVRDGFQAGTFQLLRQDGTRLTVSYQAEVLPDGCMVSHLQPVKKPVESEVTASSHRKIRPNQSQFGKTLKSR